VIYAAWIVQVIGLLASGGFIAVYVTTAWRPWEGKRAGENGREAAARQLLLSLPVALFVLMVPGTIAAALGEAPAFTQLPNFSAKVFAVAMLWFPWRLWWKARP
jgi:hypothetical protein